MTLRLQIQWPNSGHTLLADYDVHVTVDGTEIAATSSAPGQVIYDIDDGAASVVLLAQFIATNGPDQITYLTTNQTYTVDGTVLTPSDSTVVEAATGNTVNQTVHPLVDTKVGGNAVAGMTIAEIRTEYVDGTALWRSACSPSWLRDYRADGNAAASLVAVGATGDLPVLWFANFPTSLKDASDPAIPAVVFYRPTAYFYTTVDSSNHLKYNAPFALNRFLLSPRNADDAYVDPTDGSTQGRSSETINFFWPDQEYVWLRAGFEDAMINTGKQIVMFHPWPNGSNFGQASTGRLPGQLAGILRMLRGMGFIATGQDAVTLGRLGLSGFSAGGTALYSALGANRSLVKEVYAFDCNDTEANAPGLIQWARHTDDFRLHMTGANHFNANANTAATVSAFQGNGTVSAHPPDMSFWKPPAQGGSAWWDFVTQATPQLRSRYDCFHQFSVFGGETFTLDPDTGDVTQAVCYMQQFLDGSGF